jgi:hypothetical protein
MQKKDQQTDSPSSIDKPLQNMDSRDGGLLMAARSISHPVPPQTISADSGSSTFAQMIISSEEERTGDKRELETLSTAYEMLAGRVKRNRPEVEEEIQETGESSSSGDQNQSSTRAQHETFNQEEGESNVDDNILAQQRKAVLLVRLQERYPCGRLTMVRPFCLSLSPKPFAYETLDRLIFRGGAW